MSAAGFRIVARQLRGGGKAACAPDELVAVDVSDLAGVAGHPLDRLAADVRRRWEDGMRREAAGAHADLEEAVLVRAHELDRGAVLRLAEVAC